MNKQQQQQQQQQRMQRLSKGQRSRRNKQLRKAGVPIISGSGSYYTDNVVPLMRKIVPDGTFARVGSQFGQYAGSASGLPGASGLGRTVGNLAGAKLAKIAGFGKYEVSKNSLYKQGDVIPEGQDIPAFVGADNATRICHREYVMDVIVPTSPLVFNSTSFAINPGNGLLFPWLATIAAMYQQYHINGMVMEFKTLSSDITSGGALGSVVMATNYDVLDTPFNSKITMENSQYAVSAKPSRSQIHVIECDPKQSSISWHYVRDSTMNVSGSFDNRFYDLGNFQFATAGLPGATGAVLGELWISYDISFQKPEIALPFSTLAQSITPLTGVTKTNLFGGTQKVAGGSLVTAAVNTVTFANVGQYLLALHLNGTGLAQSVRSGTATVTSLGEATATLEAVWNFAVNVTSQNQTLVFDLTSSTTVTSVCLDVTPASYSVIVQ